MSFNSPNAELRGDPPALSAERPSSNDVLEGGGKGD